MWALLQLHPRETMMGDCNTTLGEGGNWGVCGVSNTTHFRIQAEGQFALGFVAAC